MYVIINNNFCFVKRTRLWLSTATSFTRSNLVDSPCPLMVPTPHSAQTRKRRRGKISSALSIFMGTFGALTHTRPLFLFLFIASLGYRYVFFVTVACVACALGARLHVLVLVVCFVCCVPACGGSPACVMVVATQSRLRSNGHLITFIKRNGVLTLFLSILLYPSSCSKLTCVQRQIKSWTLDHYTKNKLSATWTLRGTKETSI